MTIIKAKEVNGASVILTCDTEYGNYAVIEAKGNITISKSETLDYEDALTIYNDLKINKEETTNESIYD